MAPWLQLDPLLDSDTGVPTGSRPGSPGMSPLST
jgi:hypothetical protein